MVACVVTPSSYEQHSMWNIVALRLWLAVSGGEGAELREIRLWLAERRPALLEIRKHLAQIRGFRVKQVKIQV